MCATNTACCCCRAVQGGEERPCTHCPSISCSAVLPGKGMALPKLLMPLMEQGFGRRRLGSSRSAGSSRDWEGEWLSSGDKTKSIPTWSGQDFRGTREATQSKGLRIGRALRILFWSVDAQDPSKFNTKFSSKVTC